MGRFWGAGAFFRVMNFQFNMINLFPRDGGTFGGLGGVVQVLTRIRFWLGRESVYVLTRNSTLVWWGGGMDEREEVVFFFFFPT